ncbi:MAG: hypothetical protein SF070_10050 [Gemmatimonadota bacterium]|nr:hypothetical protein [Gemmatimonadota bacterium]
MRRTLLLLLLMHCAAAASDLGAQSRMDPHTLRRGVAALRLRAMLGPAVTPTRTLPGSLAFPDLTPLLRPAQRARTVFLPLGSGIDLRAGVEWWALEPRGSLGIRLRF